MWDRIENVSDILDVSAIAAIFWFWLFPSYKCILTCVHIVWLLFKQPSHWPFTSITFVSFVHTSDFPFTAKSNSTANSILSSQYVRIVYRTYIDTHRLLCFCFRCCWMLVWFVSGKKKHENDFDYFCNLFHIKINPLNNMLRCAFSIGILRTQRVHIRKYIHNLETKRKRSKKKKNHPQTKWNRKLLYI